MPNGSVAVDPGAKIAVAWAAVDNENAKLAASPIEVTFFKIALNPTYSEIFMEHRDPRQHG